MHKRIKIAILNKILEFNKGDISPDTVQDLISQLNHLNYFAQCELIANDICNLLDKGRKLEAVKDYYQDNKQRGMEIDLRKAKEFIDSLQNI